MSTAFARALDAVEPAELGPNWLIDLCLQEQQDLTAVEEFSNQHESLALSGASRYQSLLPAAPLQAGEQYAFDVDLDACSGCKACVTACHTLNGLDGTETWRQVGLLHGGSAKQPILQHVTSACHHCLDPACLNVCPVRAYEKDFVTGIVKHLDDQCFGCQYCVLACPYDVPQYNAKKGIVRKCDMCSQRLAVGEAPACVQACPHEAIRITTVSRREVLENCEAGVFLPGAPDPEYTLPTTNFHTRRILPRNLLPADYHAVRPEHAHWPLIVMLVLTQLSVGAFVVELLLSQFGPLNEMARVRPLHALAALVCGLAALGASTLHLGRPWLAYRAIVGLRTSWLSREIFAFGAFAGCATSYAGAVWLLPEQPWLPVLAGAVVVTGLAGVGCSIMIYSVIRRAYWSIASTSLRFLGTTALLGLAVIINVVLLTSGDPRALLQSYAGTLLQALALVTIGKLVIEAAPLRSLRDRQQTPLKRTALLMTGALRPVVQWRYAFGLLGGVLCPLLMLSEASSGGSPQSLAGVVAPIALVACLAGELFERYLFFTAVVANRMPGGMRA